MANYLILRHSRLFFGIMGYFRQQLNRAAGIVVFQRTRQITAAAKYTIYRFFLLSNYYDNIAYKPSKPHKISDLCMGNHVPVWVPRLPKP
jgi:hypothetical protein